MRVEAILYRDGVTITVSQTFVPHIYKDYMIQASEMCMPFFMMGYHMKNAYIKGDGDENTKTQQGAKEGNPTER